MASWRTASVRTRLTLWYTAALGVVLTVYAAGVLLLLRHNLIRALDRQLHNDFEFAEERLEEGEDGSVHFRPPSHHGEHGLGGSVEVWDSEGPLIYRSRALEQVGFELPRPSLTDAPAGYESLRSVSGRPVRAFFEPHTVNRSRVVMRVSRSEEPTRHELWQFFLSLAFGLPFALALAGAGGYVLARRALSPVAEMAAQATTITADRLEARLSVENPHDELGRLASVFNDTLARLEASFDQLRRFTADASHELRTPLTAIRSVGEVALSERREESEYRRTIGSMLEEVDRLTALVNALLVLSRADAAHTVISTERVDLISLVNNVAEQLGVLAEEKGQSLEVEGDASVTAVVDRPFLSRAVMNLVDNAIKYTPEGGRIRVRVKAEDASASIEVSDTGPGIPSEHRELIFDRFYRIDKARSREVGGTGLGLSLARLAVELHGGRIELQTSSNEGATFRVIVPLSQQKGVSR